MWATVLLATQHWTCPTLTTAVQAAIWFTCPRGMEGWVNADGTEALKNGKVSKFSFSKCTCIWKSYFFISTRLSSCGKTWKVDINGPGEFWKMHIKRRKESHSKSCFQWSVCTTYLGIIFLSLLYFVGCSQHYPGASSPDAALRLDKKLWASEEYSTFNDMHGGGCWARVSSVYSLTALLRLHGNDNKWVTNVSD